MIKYYAINPDCTEVCCTYGTNTITYLHRPYDDSAWITASTSGYYYQWNFKTKQWRQGEAPDWWTDQCFDVVNKLIAFVEQMKSIQL